MAGVAVFVWGIWIWQERQQETLWSLAPKEIAVWADFNLANQELVKYLDGNVEAQNQLKRFFVNNDWPVALNQSGVEIRRAARIIIPDEKTGEITVGGWVVRSKDNIDQLNAFLSGYYYQTLDKRTMVFAKDQRVVRAVSGQKNGQRINGQQERLAREAAVYVVGQNIGWQKISGKDTAIDWLKSKIRVEQTGIVFGWLKAADKELTFGLELPIKLGDRKIKSNEAAQPVAIRGAISLGLEGISNLWSLMTQASENDYGSKEKIEKQVSEKYQTDITKLYTIFEQPLILVVRPRRPMVNFRELLDLDRNDYVLVSDFEGQTDEVMVAGGLETFGKNYLAFKFPEKRQKILPDKTVGYEIVANPEKFLVETEKLSKGELKFIALGEQQWGYGWQGKKLLIFNAKELARTVGEAQLERGETRGRENEMIIDAQVLGGEWLGFLDFVGVSFQETGAGVIVSGHAWQATGE